MNTDTTAPAIDAAIAENLDAMRRYGMTVDRDAIDTAATAAAPALAPVWHCVSDAYDPSGAVPYTSPEEFLAMCADVFGEAPTLHYDAGRGVYCDADGAVVLVAL